MDSYIEQSTKIKIIAACSLIASDSNLCLWEDEQLAKERST